MSARPPIGSRIYEIQEPVYVGEANETATLIYDRKRFAKLAFAVGVPLQQGHRLGR